jgi:D-proline reductase (dithiol) PrdB
MPPLAPLGRPLREARVGLITAGGTHLASDRPFDMANQDGDASFRVIPGDVDVGDIRITHDYYDHGAADRDVNCVFPIERLREFAVAGEIGEVAPRHVGMMGHLLGAEAERLVGQTAHEMARVFADDRVDLVVASPG